MFEQFIRFILSHNLAIIQWLIFAIVGIGVMALGMMIFGKDEASSSSDHASATNADQAGTSTVNMDELAAKLKEVMASVAQTGATFAGGPLNPEQMGQFQAELQTKRQEVEELKKAVAEAQSKSESADVATYLKKIKDLENRLAEYEILEDDIADLSLFKEENARLKEELARVKGGEAAVVTSEEIVEEFQAAIDESKEVESSSDEGTDGFMAALEDEVSGDALSSSEPAPSEAPAPDPVPASEPETADDLLSEFAAELGQEVSEGEASGADLDADKMLAELSGLEEVADDGSALEELTDMEKMASEASTLLKE